MHQTPAIDKVFQRTRVPLTLADPNHSDTPLIRVNASFCDITGYSEDQCVGRNCRFLQGADRSQPAKIEIRDALKKQHDVQVVLRNYTQAGDGFDCLIFVHHIRDLRGNIVFLLGSQFVIEQRESAESLNRHLNALDEDFAMLAETHQEIHMNVKRQISASTNAMLHSAVLQDRLSRWTRR